MRYKIVKYVSNDFCHGYIDICDTNNNVMLWPTEDDARKWLVENSEFPTLEDTLQHYSIQPYFI